MSTRATIGPGDVDAWAFDWTAWLARKSEEQGVTVTIASALWTATGGLVVLGSPPPAIFDSGRQARAWWDAESMSDGDSAELTCRITTSAGHEREATVVLDVRDR